MMLAGILSITFFCSFFLTYYFWRYPWRRLQDQATERSLHVGRVPRSGGLAIVLALILAGACLLAVWKIPFSQWVLWGLGVLCVVSLWDDITSLSPLWRLAAQCVVTSMIVWGGNIYFAPQGAGPVWCFLLLSMLGLMWWINLYNFMDGMDGLAAGMALIGFGTLAWLGWLQADMEYARLNGLVVAAVAGFWCWNLPPARIFMGDCGATLLGALVAVLGLMGVQRQLFPLWVPLLLFSPFWLDATYTLCGRIWRREAFWLPHRQHFYQRLVARMGPGHRLVMLAEYVLMLACALSVALPPLWGLDYNSLVPAGWGVAYLLLIVCLERRLGN